MLTFSHKQLRKAICIGLAISFAATAAHGVSKGYKVRAAYLYNFLKYIDWPGSSFSGADAPISICVLGEDRFEGILETATSGKSVKGRAVSIKNFPAGAPAPPASECQILFISDSEKDRVDELLAAVAGSAIATVSEVGGFGEKGGMLNFSMQGAKMKVELNMGAAEKAGLKVSAKLQQVSTPVETG